MPVSTAERGQRAGVSTGHPLATAAAVEILGEGGTAVDASIAAAFVLMVTLPHACSIAGDAMVLVYGEGRCTAINGSGPVPAGWDGSTTPSDARLMSVPGVVAALAEAHRNGGRTPWSRLMAPAQALAADGFPVSRELASAIRRHHALLVPAEWPWSDAREGDLIREPALAAAIARIAQHGGQEFYDGEVSGLLVAGARRRGSAITAADLAQHRTPSPPPVELDYRGRRLFLQPPVSQGVLTAVALRAADSRPPETVELVEAMDLAFRLRPRVTTQTWQETLDHTQHLGRDDERGPTAGTHTTSIACIDADGTAVSMLISVYHEFGCGIYVPELGSFLNNRVKGVELAPLATDGRPLHTLAPMVIVDGDSVTAVATPGADAQVQVMAQIAASLIRDGVTLTESVERPRWRLQDGRLLMEPGTPDSVVRQAEKRGYDVAVVPDEGLVYGSVTAVSREGSAVTAVADSRRSCSAAAL